MHTYTERLIHENTTNRPHSTQTKSISSSPTRTLTATFPYLPRARRPTGPLVTATGPTRTRPSSASRLKFTGSFPRAKIASMCHSAASPASPRSHRRLSSSGNSAIPKPNLSRDGESRSGSTPQESGASLPEEVCRQKASLLCHKLCGSSWTEMVKELWRGKRNLSSDGETRILEVMVEFITLVSQWPSLTLHIRRI